MWYELKNICCHDPRRISAQVRLPPASPWFRGHFPGEPILPGVALIAMVQDLIGRTGGGRAVKSLKRVRFKQIVRPGDVLEIAVSFESGRREKGAFQITAGGEVVCSGRVLFQAFPSEY